MERLTEDRGSRTWRLFRIGWYFNVALVIVALLFSAYYFIGAQVGDSLETTRNVTMMATMLVVASILLMGAGISRYEARLEGQHLEIKLAIKQLEAELEEFKAEKP